MTDTSRLPEARVSNKLNREEEESLLMAKIGRADMAALEALYHRFRPRLHRFLRALGCPEAELDEICNETFYVVWCKSGSFDGSCRPSTWILGIARNKVMDLLRRERRRRISRVEAEIGELPDGRLGDADRFELHQWLEAALNALPADQRVVVELAFFEGLSYQEIAAVLKCPEGTVKTRIFYARRKLKHAFPEFGNARGRRNSQ